MKKIYQILTLALLLVWSQNAVGQYPCGAGSIDIVTNDINNTNVGEIYYQASGMCLAPNPLPNWVSTNITASSGDIGVSFDISNTTNYPIEIQQIEGSSYSGTVSNTCKLYTKSGSGSGYGSQLASGTYSGWTYVTQVTFSMSVSGVALLTGLSFAIPANSTVSFYLENSQYIKLNTSTPSNGTTIASDNTSKK